MNILAIQIYKYNRHMRNHLNTHKYTKHWKLAELLRVEYKKEPFKKSG